jgi:hypothetical protein
VVIVAIPLIDPAVHAGELLGVWDTRDKHSRWWQPAMPEAVAWAAQHIADAENTYRTEFRQLDGPYAVVWRYRLDSGGRRYFDPETGEAASEGPVIQALGELPPAHLLGH